MMRANHNVEPPDVICRSAGIRADAGEPIHRKTLLSAAERLGVRPGTAVKTLAELVRDGELANPMYHNGYRLPEWWSAPTGQPGLFDGVV